MATACTSSCGVKMTGRTWLGNNDARQKVGCNAVKELPLAPASSSLSFACRCLLLLQPRFSKRPCRLASRSVLKYCNEKRI